ncbi:MAG: hypothetical protein LBT57_00430 [Puniceicoccales bacterium]|jgi:hypothetical protein|nr:hypothetical protein [Puniceicoccales bacterium]
MLLVLSSITVLLLWIIFINFCSVFVRERQQKHRSHERLQLCAEYALQDALQHLQSAAAADQRVSARAEIFDATDDGVPESQRLWTGVWRTELEGRVQDTPQFFSWLVSHPHEAGACQYIHNEAFPRTQLEDKNSYAWSSDEWNSPQVIRAPWVDIRDSESHLIGRYAYWIEDESQKACCTLPHRENLEAEVLRSCPPQNGTDFLDGLSRFPQSSPQLSSCETLEELEARHPDFQVTGSDNPSIRSLRFYEHDLSCCSKGLLTDSCNGGFRKDLTAFFQEAAPAPPYPALTEEIFRVENADPEPAPSWGILRNFARLGEGVVSGKREAQLATKTYTPIDYKDYSSWQRSDLPREELQIPEVSPLAPIITHFSLLIRVKKMALDTSSGNGSLRFEFIPQLTLYNPHNVTLNPRTYRFSYKSLKDRTPQAAIRAVLLSPGTAEESRVTLALGGASGIFWELLSCTASVGELPAGQSVTMGLGDSWPSTEMNGGKALLSGGQGAFTHDWNFRLQDISPWWAMSLSSFALVVERIPGITAGSGSMSNGWQHFYLFLQDETSLAQEVAKVQIEDGSSSAPKSVEQKLLSMPLDMSSVPLFGLSACLKSDREVDCSGNNGMRWLAEGNPRASWMGRSQLQDGDYMAPNPMIPAIGNAGLSNWHWSAKWLPTDNLSNLNVLPPGNSFSGILFDIPRKDFGVLNLAFLQHANVTPFGYHPAYAIGNSLQAPRIAREAAFRKNSAGPLWVSHCKVEMLYDYSYLLNRALWDSYFLSAVRDGKSLNPRLWPWKVKEDLGNILNPWNDRASRLYIRGAFNVHSTSVSAWFAVLCGLYDSREDKVSFGRFPGKSTGRIQLSRDQLWSLAEGIVVEVKRRGVVSGLSDFINRRLVDKNSPQAAQGLKGALQTAIDASLHGAEVQVNSTRDMAGFDDEAASGDRSFGRADYLTQADLLQSLGTFLTARGDSFTIHVCTELLSPQGQKIRGLRADVKAQRMPDYLDPSHPQQGRRFILRPVRWSR